MTATEALRTATKRQRCSYRPRHYLKRGLVPWLILLLILLEMKRLLLNMSLQKQQQQQSLQFHRPIVSSTVLSDVGNNSNTISNNSRVDDDNNNNNNNQRFESLNSKRNNSVTFLDQAAQETQQVLFQETVERQPFDITTWNQTTQGGLYAADRPLLGRIYSHAESVFEWGLGESTWIASHVGVPRYAGIDSDAAWVAAARDKALPHFRFYLADIGKTGVWGYPSADTKKAYLNYQLAPMLSEQLPFDVYMVDGRYRLACMLIAFLHASARGADPSETTVLLHDCYQEGVGPKRLDRPQYRKADHLLTLVEHSGNRLCVYQRKNDTTDEQLYDLWLQEYQVVE